MKSLKNKHYVYRHTRLDTNIPFYVGKGSGNRASSKHSRNRWWKFVEAKHGREVQIVKRFETHEEALKFEIQLIKLYKSFGYCETNLTPGGEGVVGLTPWNKGIPMSEETKKKVSEAKKNPSAETRRRISEAGKGRISWNAGLNLTKEHIAKLSQAKKGKKYSDEYKLNMAKVKGSKQFSVHSLESGIYIGSWYGKKTCARDLNIDRAAVCKCLKGTQRQTKGYTFKYEE